MQGKTAKMEVWRQNKTLQMHELPTGVTRVHEKTKEQVKKLERKCCGKITEHHEWLINLERRNESSLQEVQAQKLSVGRLE